MAEPAVRTQAEEPLALPAKPAPAAAPERLEEPRQGATAAPVTPTIAGTRPAAATARPTAATGKPSQAPERPPGWSPAAYLALSMACLACAVAFLALPGLTARVLFRKAAADPLDAQHYQLLHLNGGALLAAAGAIALLAFPAGWADVLGERGADLLKLVLAVQCLSDTLNTAYYAPAIRPLLLPLAVITNATMAAVPATDLLTTGRYKGLLPELRRRLASPRPGRPWLASAHYLLALLLPLPGAALYFLPKFAHFHTFGYAYGSSTFLLSKFAGAAWMGVIPLVNLLLKASKHVTTVDRVVSWFEKKQRQPQVVAQARPSLPSWAEGQGQEA